MAVLGRGRHSLTVPVPFSNPSVVYSRSAYCSLSVLNRPPSSAMRITPTPRAMSPKDIVRIYVPPPPPEELYGRPNDLRLSHNNNNNNVSSEGRSPESDCRTVIQRTPTQELPGSVSTATITSQSMRSLNQHQWTSREEPLIVPSGGGLQTTLRDLALYSSQSSLKGGHGSTSSSRRGSMSRKSSVIVESLAGDCPHIRVTSGGGGRDSQRHSFGDGGLIHVEYEAILARANQNKPKKEPRIMTSFEKLAQMNDTFSFRGDHSEGRREVKLQHSDDEAFSYSFQAMRRSGGAVDQGARGNDSQTTKCTSDYNIKYNGGGDGEKRPVGDGHGVDDTREVEAGHELGAKKKNKKQYDRFFTPDESEEDFDEGQFDGHELAVGKKKRPGHRKEESVNHSSSPSSSSKSLLATPVNETQPLLDAEDDATTTQYNFKHSRGVEQVPKRVRHKKADREEADEEGYDDGEISSSPTYKTGSAYYAHRSSSYIPISEDQPSVNSPVERNTIRIRVNEKGK